MGDGPKTEILNFKLGMESPQAIKRRSLFTASLRPLPKKTAD